jgi:hypothetical protein
LKRNEPYFDE